jgi:hypothetical protein
VDSVSVDLALTGAAKAENPGSKALLRVHLLKGGVMGEK